MTGAAAVLSGYERAADDWYVEPPAATRALLEAEHFFGSVWDPCCGEGRICRVLDDHVGIEPKGTDLVDRLGYPKPWWWYGERDFFNCANLHPHSIITNPPFKRINEFIELAITRVKHKLAVYSELRILTGVERKETIFDQLPRKCTYVFANRQNCPPGGIKAGKKNTVKLHCWTVFEIGYRGPWTLHQLVTEKEAV